MGMHGHGDGLTADRCVVNIVFVLSFHRLREIQDATRRRGEAIRGNLDGGHTKTRHKPQHHSAGAGMPDGQWWRCRIGGGFTQRVRREDGLGKPASIIGEQPLLGG